MISPFQIVLLISLAANALLGYTYLGQRDDLTALKSNLQSMEQQRDGARRAASDCSDAVEDMRTLADKRLKAAATARAEASDAAKKANKRADDLLKSQPAVPGDMCASAQIRVDTWLQNRGQK